VTDECLDWLARRGYDAQYGARPLKRVIQRYVSDPLALKVLGAEVSVGDTIVVDCDAAGQIMFAIAPTEPSPSQL
jgi:ATP-dependent Clp protease ATP-binding subunit ClpB